MKAQVTDVTWVCIIIVFALLGLLLWAEGGKIMYSQALTYAPLVIAGGFLLALLLGASRRVLSWIFWGGLLGVVLTYLAGKFNHQSREG